MSAATVGGLLNDTAALTGRSLRRATREVDALLLAIALPVLLMVLFVTVFGGAISPDGRYVDYVVPGVILLCAGYGAAQTAVAVASDDESGVMRRLRTLPVSSAAILAGHVAASLARNAVTTLAVLVVALALGFRPSPGWTGAFVAAGIVGLFVLAISWLSAWAGLVAGSVEVASGLTFFVLFLPYLSSAFVPTATMPTWLQGVAEHQPITPVIETLRAALAGTSSDQASPAVAWCFGLLALGMVGATYAFRHRARR